MRCKTTTSSVACPGGWQDPGGGGRVGGEGLSDSTEAVVLFGQALRASSLDPGLLPLPLCAGDAVAELLHPGDRAWPAPEIPGDGPAGWLGRGVGESCSLVLDGATCCSPRRQGPLTCCVTLGKFLCILMKWGEHPP